MIIPTYTEEEILRELIFDYKIVKRMAKKIAVAHLDKVKKSGGFIRETDYDSYTITTVSKNVWNVEIEYDQTKKIPWLFRTCCKVEGDKKTKDYYIVRGLNTEKPYFVKVTSHALKRVKERNSFSNPESIKPELLACWVFEHREIAVCMRFVEMKYTKLLINMDDVDEIENMSYIVLTNRGTYYALKTPGGNYIFKTFISSYMGVKEVINYKNGKITKWHKEGELLYNMFLMHQYFNKHLYDKHSLDNWLYSVINKDDELELNKNSPLFLLRN